MRPSATLNLTQYNTSNTKVQASVNITRDVALSTAVTSELVVERFRVCNRLVPVFVPEYGTLQTQLSTLNIPTFTYVATTPAAYQPWQLTNMNVFVKGKTGSGIPTFTYCPVIWQPLNQNDFPPLDYQNKESRLNSPYFHVFNTLPVCKMVATALENALETLNPSEPNPVQIIKTGTVYALLLKDNANNKFEIAFNEPLKRVLGFNYAPHEYAPNCYHVVIDSSTQSQVTLGGVNYYATYTVTQNQFFPFDTLQFETSHLSVQPQAVQNTAIQRNDQQSSIVTDFLLQVEDVDQIYNYFDFIPTNIERVIPLTGNSIIQQIDLRVLLHTSDGVKVPLYLSPNDMMSIKLLVR